MWRQVFGGIAQRREISSPSLRSLEIVLTVDENRVVEIVQLEKLSFVFRAELVEVGHLVLDLVPCKTRNTPR